MSSKFPEKKLVVGISSSALFDLAESDQIFREKGVTAYADYQMARESEILLPGDAFYLVNKFLSLNERLGNPDRVEVILLSRNTADTGLRVFHSIQHYGLPIVRAAFTGGFAPYRYMRPFGCHLFLSTNADDVIEALANGIAAASILPSSRPATLPSNLPPNQKKDPAIQSLSIAFDGDAVIFSDEAERIYQTEGLDAFSRSESEFANRPLAGGPFKPFLAALHQLQSEFPKVDCPIRTALVTARSAPAHERVIKTLRAWGIRLDESLFLGGMQKSEFLRAFGADVFFDDQADHCLHASKVVPTGHVLHGITNEPKSD